MDGYKPTKKNSFFL